MKFLKKLIGGLFVALFLILMIGLFLPSKTEVSESIVIKAPAKMVFQEVNDLKNWSNWSPWQKRDPQAIVRYEGSETGVGSKMLWDSKSRKVGSGSQEIIVSEPHRHIEIALRFRGWNHPTYAIWDFEEQEGGDTKVTWSYKGQVGGNVFHKYMAAMIKSSLKKDYATGLQQLKACIEQKVTPAIHEGNPGNAGNPA